ncbi:MAG: hypothetical protein PHV11_10220 [Candidatus Bipolaricaulis sp.]|nr:hypothetical protein [Candidatus Bipolaricaulis sp.]
MKGRCVKCGQPLKKGNIKVIHPKGKKRPFRVCRRCPGNKPEVSIEPGLQAAERTSERLQVEHVKAMAERDFPQAVNFFGETAGNPVQRPQDTTGGPVTVEGVFHYDPPPKFRYFMTQAQVEKVKRALGRPVYAGFGIGFEVIPVPEYQVEADPDSFADLVEITINWKVE